MTDALGRVTQTAFDCDSEVIAVTDPMGRVTSIGYDLDGQITAVTDAAWAASPPPLTMPMERLPQRPTRWAA